LDAINQREAIASEWWHCWNPCSWKILFRLDEQLDLSQRLTALRQPLLFVYANNHGSLMGSSNIPKDFYEFGPIWFHPTNLTESVDDICGLIPIVQHLKGGFILGDNDDDDDDAPELLVRVLAVIGVLLYCRWRNL
jgi:hypothetical protein